VDGQETEIARASIRRPLMMEELARLLWVAERRPLAEYGRHSVHLPQGDRKGRKTWTKASLTLATLDAAVARARQALAHRPNFVAWLEARGRRNAMPGCIMEAIHEIVWK